MRHQHLLVRRLGLLLRSRITTQGHLAAITPQEGRGNCLPPRNGCSKACTEARELIALTEPFLTTAPRRPVRRTPRMVGLKRPRRRMRQAPLLPGLFDGMENG